MSTAGSEPASVQLPGQLVRGIFGAVNVRRTSQATEVHFSILARPEGEHARGWKTGVALDASASMLKYYGRGLISAGARGVPTWLLDDYRRKGWISVYDEDGTAHTHRTEEAGRDAVARGYLRRSKNLLNPLAQRLTSYLAEGLDADGGTTILYWGCGDGGAYEVLGDFTGEQCNPPACRLGSGSRCGGTRTSSISLSRAGGRGRCSSPRSVTARRFAAHPLGRLRASSSPILLRLRRAESRGLASCENHWHGTRSGCEDVIGGRLRLG